MFVQGNVGLYIYIEYLQPLFQPHSENTSPQYIFL